MASTSAPDHTLGTFASLCHWEGRRPAPAVEISPNLWRFVEAKWWGVEDFSEISDFQSQAFHGIPTDIQTCSDFQTFKVIQTFRHPDFQTFRLSDIQTFRHVVRGINLQRSMAHHGFKWDSDESEGRLQPKNRWVPLLVVFPWRRASVSLDISSDDDWVVSILKWFHDLDDD